MPSQGWYIQREIDPSYSLASATTPYTVITEPPPPFYSPLPIGEGGIKGGRAGWGL